MPRDAFSRLARQRRAARGILLGVLIYCVVLDALYFLLPDSAPLHYLRPFTVTNAFPAVYPVLHYPMAALSVLPLLGWFLLQRGIRLGRQLIVVPYVAAWVIVGLFTFLHLLYALRSYSARIIGATLLDAVPFLPFGIGVPVLLHLWQRR